MSSTLSMSISSRMHKTSQRFATRCATSWRSAKTWSSFTSPDSHWALTQTATPNANSDQPFSEMAMYVLVRRKGEWWLAAGQNTPIRPGGAVPATT